MTDAEKLAVIQKYCNERSCDRCKIFRSNNHHNNLFNSELTPWEIEIMYELITGKLICIDDIPEGTLIESEELVADTNGLFISINGSVVENIDSFEITFKDKEE